MSKITDTLQMKFDELNIMTSAVLADSKSVEDCEDSIEDLLIMAYADGAKATDDVIDELHEIDTVRMFEVVMQKIDGKDFKERIREYYEQGDGESIKRVAETETHRIYNQAVLDTASQSDKTLYKTWVTMQDDKVRETHFYLEGERKPLGEEFITIGGYSAQAPGLFGVAKLDVNCRCTLEISE